MSTTTPPAPPDDAPKADAVADDANKQGDPAVDEPLGEPGKKALQAERAARAQAEQAQAALQKQLDEIEASKLSDIERAQKEANAAKEEAAKAQAEVLRFRIAAEAGIKENVELILTGPDESTMRAQADLWSNRTPSTTNPKPDLSQGGKTTPPAGEDETREFARQLFSAEG
jgi:broad specificity phosphatase PhoE